MLMKQAHMLMRQSILSYANKYHVNETNAHVNETIHYLTESQLSSKGLSICSCSNRTKVYLKYHVNYSKNKNSTFFYVHFLLI